MVPALIILLMFIYLLCKYIIEDYYLRKSIYFFFANLIVNVIKSIVILVRVFHAEAERQEYDHLFEEIPESESFLIFTSLYIEITMQFNMNCLVYISFIFSAHTFYQSLRNLLFPAMR